MARPRTTQSRLTTLPYDILYNILNLVLPELPSRYRLVSDSTKPAWMNVFSGDDIEPCPPILLVCRILTRFAIRILYTFPRLSIHPGRTFLTQLSQLPARRYIQNIELAVEVRFMPSSTRKTDVCAPHQLVSFYSPGYLVDLLRRIFPRLSSVHLTVVETTESQDKSNQKHRCCHTDPSKTESDVHHCFPLASLTKSEPFNRLIMSLEYKTDRTFLHPRWLVPDRRSQQHLALGLELPDEEINHQIRRRVLAKFAPLSPTILPNLKNVQFYLRTERSVLNEPWGRLSKLYSERREYRSLREQFEVITSKELFGQPDVRITLFRTQIADAQDFGWERMDSPQAQKILFGAPNEEDDD